VQGIVRRSNLKVIRPLRFTKNRFLMRSSSAAGTAVLGVANQLNQTAGIKSATPNFIQSPPQKVTKILSHANPLNISKITQNFKNKPNYTRSANGEPSFQTQLSWLQWHLDSRPMETLVDCSVKYPEVQPKFVECINTPRDNAQSLRADIHAVEAWQQSNGGEGAVVAVLDSLIQWDHPDLAKNIYSVGNVADRLPNENYGWDFADNDADTRISDAELALYSPLFQSSFVASDADLLQQDPDLAALLRQSSPSSSERDIAKLMRETIQGTIASLFHGTMVGGVIAARSPDGTGLIGVAPNAKILPVSIGRDSFAPDAVIEGIGYAAARGADVINMSFAFSGFAPVRDMADTILEAQQQRPDLVFVAAAGNEASDEISFPANTKGVLSVGATNVTRNLASYSNFGKQIDLVAPGGDLSIQALGKVGGILTTGGTWVKGFWQGIPSQPGGWSEALDSKGQYLWTEGTSFASPAVAGVVALMKGEDPQRQLDRDRVNAILLETASDKELVVTEGEMSLYDSIRQETQLPPSMTSKQFFFGRGLVNAALAVEKVKRSISDRTR
jgi:serine protease